VTLVAATTPSNTSSYRAQGGLAAALSDDDSPAQHYRDTERVGRGLVRPSAASTVCELAPSLVEQLREIGVGFDTDPHGRLQLGLEGGHSRRRVVHAGGGATGQRVVRQLSSLAALDPSITIVDPVSAVALLLAGGECAGVVCSNRVALAADAVVICTGGAAALWARTTNPPGSLGSGLLLALAAGATLADLEFVQFHPTVVSGIPGLDGFLVSEAVRGEGATLHDSAGERFVDELAPRDEVARAVWVRLQASGTAAVQLDLRAVDPARFPNIFSALRDAGVDPSVSRIAVAPAAHYTMGGIVTDLEGRSTVPRLYAVGEVACTGLHGANRLASNSLTECFVFAARAGRAAAEEPRMRAGSREVAAAYCSAPSSAAREAMWRHAGLIRSPDGLAELSDASHPLARLVARCAMLREESRGAHARADYPSTDPDLAGRHTVVDRWDGAPRLELWADV
jgi:L-aspartate oxidase